MPGPDLAEPAPGLAHRLADARAQAAVTWARTTELRQQAEGIIMARSRCGEAEAFDLLRRASQRSNIPVRDLAAQIVATASATAPAGQNRSAARSSD